MSRQPADGRAWAAGSRAVAWPAAAAWLLCVLAGCQPGGFWWGVAGTTRPADPEVTGLRMHRPESMEKGWGEGLERAVFRAARNEWLDCVVTPGELPGSEGVGGDDGRGGASRGLAGELVWRLWPVSPEAASPGAASTGAASTGAASATEGGRSAEVQAAGWSVRAYRVVSVPADTRDVAWVRRAGPGAASQPLPRALVPLEAATARGSAGEARFTVPPGTRAVYVEWCVPVEASPGRYAGELTWRVGGAERTLPLELTVDDLTLSGSNDFAVVGEVAWDELVGAWPGVFGRVDPRLLSRLDPSHVSAVERLDQLVRLARQHRVDVSFLELAPTVKNTPREGLRLDWTEYDTVVLPWLRGEAAAETPSGRDGLGAVATLPSSRWLRAGGGRRPAEDVAAYWRSVASHFDQQRLLSRMVLPEQLAAAELGDVGERRVRGRVEVPEERWGWAGVRQGAWRAAAASAEAMSDGEPPRVAVVARGVLFRADAGRGVRGAGGASSRAAWFYPAERLDGVPRGTAVVPGIGLKWARRAQQDWELLELAYRRGGGGAGGPGGAAGPGGRQVVLSVLQVMAGGSGTAPPTGPGSASVGRPDEPGTDLLADASDAEVWTHGMELVRRAAAWQDPTRFRSESEAQAWRMMEAAELRRWLLGVEVPRFLATAARWSQAVPGGTLRLEVRLTPVEAGVQRRVVGLPEAAVEGDLVRVSLPVDMAWSGEGWSSAWAVSATASPPSEAVFTRELSVPVAAVRPSTDAGAVRLDGSLDEWTSGEAVHRGGLVRMLDAGTAASGRLVRSGKDTLVLMRWEPEGLWVGLRLSGVSHRGAAVGTNFVTEAQGRAFGEDLCRLVLRSGGSEVRLLLKPAGLTVEEAPAGVASAVVPYAAVTEGVPGEGGRDERVWRAELRVPSAMLGGPLSVGQAIEMNLIRHDRETGESSSWAGPIDRDLQPFRGVLVLRGP